MDLIDRLGELATLIQRRHDNITSEEATKTALVMPFINALGYNVFDPAEVVPEYTADVGTKKGEKVDYAILKDGKPIILFEVKTLGTNLREVHTSQLYRYFSVTEARFGILTDGAKYWFFTDLDEPNKMDAKPFFVFDLHDFNVEQVEELKRFSKSTFDLGNILSTASELKYTREIRNLLAEEFTSPSEGLVRHFAGQVYSRRMTQAVIEEFTKITRNAFRAFINERIERRLKTALAKEATATDEVDDTVEQESKPSTKEAPDGIVTTQDEIDGFLVVKAILYQVVDVNRITLRDVKSYCGILLDDNNRQPICRLHFNTSQKYLGVFDEGKKEERIPIDSVADIYQYAERLKATVAYYERDK